MTTVRQSGITGHIDCDDADEFLNVLAPRGIIAGGTEAVGSYTSIGDAWIFRGHADDSYTLTPSALRNEGSFSVFNGAACRDNESQIRNEIRTLERFFNLSDTTGLPLPEDSQAIRSEIRYLRSEKYFEDLNNGRADWPPSLLWSLLAIAQHNGVPTRLLDWSRRALPAAYFAAEGATMKLAEARNTRDRLLNGVQSPADSDKLAESEAELEKLNENWLSVWAFRYDRFASRFDKSSAEFFQEPVPPDVPIEKVTAPHANNPNLHAQDGLFTLEHQNLRGCLQAEVDRTPLNELVEKFLQKHGKLYENDRLFYRVRLRWIHAPHLLWRLRQEGVNTATIYPGYKGVVMAMQMEDQA